jgi:hypothetical protein
MKGTISAGDLAVCSVGAFGLNQPEAISLFVAINRSDVLKDTADPLCLGFD